MAIAHDATTAHTTTAATTTKTFAHTCTGSDRILFVGVGTNNVAVSGVTYNGVAMTRANTVTLQASIYEIWYLVAPATGSNNVIITTASSTTIAGGAMSFTGASQTGVPDSSFVDSAQTASVTSYSISTTTVADNDFLFMNGRANAGATLTAGTNTTVSQPEVTAFGSFMMRSTAAITPAGTGTLACTSTAQQFFGGIVSFKPVGVTVSNSNFLAFMEA